MKNQASTTATKVRDKLLAKYEGTVEKEGGTLDDTGRRAFYDVFEATVGKENTGVEQNWGRDHGFLYEVTKRLAVRAVRYAKKQDKTTKIQKRHVIRAANCLIPDISRYCMKGRIPKGSRFQTKGPYCKDWDDMPEN